MSQFRDQGFTIRRPSAVNRFVVLAIACVVFIVCGVSANAARAAGRHKGISRLTLGLRSVKSSAKQVRKRLAALKNREETLLTKIDEVGDEETNDGSEHESSTTCFAKIELSKIRYEKRALAKKLKTCELNKKCILAEIEVVSEEVQPLNPLGQDIRFRRPIRGKITSGYGVRLHPLEHIEKLHQGIDLAGDIGDPVRATADGKVTFAGNQRGYGQIIIIQHSDELSSAYGHLSEFSVAVGDTLSSGEKNW